MTKNAEGVREEQSVNTTNCTDDEYSLIGTLQMKHWQSFSEQPGHTLPYHITNHDVL